MANVVTHLVEVLLQPTSQQIRAVQYAVEALVPYTAPSPTTITGGGVSQELVEVLLQQSVAQVRVPQYLTEVLLQPIEGYYLQ